MRLLTRRNALGGALGLAGAGGAYAWFRRRHGSDQPQALDVHAKPIAVFEPGNPSRRVFGSLEFRSGLVLAAKADGFGGFSGLWRDPNGPQLVAVTDHGQWLNAEVVHGEGRLVGLRNARLSPILGPDGDPLRDGARYDCEALAIADGFAFVGIERQHTVLRFPWGPDFTAGRGERVAVPDAVSRLPNNAGIEALAIAPKAHPLAGALLAIAEGSSGGSEEPILGWVLTGPSPFAFGIAKAPHFNATDAVFLPTGEFLLLERSFSLLDGAGCRIRRFAQDVFRPGAVAEGEVIFQADRAFEIDNMEGLSWHRDAATGETVLTLMSDDNFVRFQRTLLLEFTLRR